MLHVLFMVKRANYCHLWMSILQRDPYICSDNFNFAFSCSKVLLPHSIVLPGINGKLNAKQSVFVVHILQSHLLYLIASSFTTEVNLPHKAIFSDELALS